jgi:tetratricopeptide (TPR) repeat protein
MSRYPNQIVHAQGLVHVLAAAEQHAEALAVVEDCCERWPEHWWPRLARAIIESRLGRFEKAEKELQRWVEKHNTFGHYYFLSRFYLLTQHDEQAYATLRRAIPSPQRDWLPDDQATGDNLGYFSDHFLCMAAVQAYDGQQFNLVLDLADTWERHHAQQQRVIDLSYPVLRAAALLALRRYDEAKTALQPAQQYVRRRSIWACNLDELESAIRNKDSSFVYHFGNYPDQLHIDVAYE